MKEGVLLALSALCHLAWTAPRGHDRIALDEIPSYYEADILPDKTVTKMAVRDNHKLWPGGRMPFRFDFDENQYSYVASLVRAAVKKINAVGCVSIYPASDADHDYVLFTFGSDYSSHVGRQGGVQNLTVVADLIDKGTVMHELMHALGFGHEHNRPDRDEYVTVDFSNIQEAARPYFTIYESGGILEGDDLAYDYTSLMHATSVYDSDINIDLTKPVIWRNDGETQLGQRAFLTEGDQQRLKQTYSCNVCKEVDNDGHWFRYPGDCTKFIHCSGSFPYVMPCPAGLHFSLPHLYCDYPTLAECTSPQTLRTAP